MKIEVKLTGETLADIIQGARDLVHEGEKMVAALSVTSHTSTAVETEETAAPAAAAPAKRGRKPKAQTPVADETGAEAEDDSADFGFGDDEPAAPAKTYTLEDVNGACRAHMQKGGGTKEARAATVALLRSKFNINSVNELKPAQYADVMKALA